MATKETIWKIKAKDEASQVAKTATERVKKSLKGVAGELKSAGKATKNFSDSLRGFATAAVAVFAIDKLISSVAQLTSTYAEQEKADKKLQAVLKSTGHAAGLTYAQLKQMATGLQSVTTFADETIQTAQHVLLTFTKIGKEVFPDATETVLNISAAMGTDAKSGAVQLGKALNDPIKGLSSLTEVGVSFTDQQRKEIENFQKMGDIASAQKIILNELSVEFGGMAEAMAQTDVGEMEQLNNILTDQQELLGKELVPIWNDYIEVQIKSLKLLTTLVEGFKLLGKFYSGSLNIQDERIANELKEAESTGDLNKIMDARIKITNRLSEAEFKLRDKMKEESSTTQSTATAMQSLGQVQGTIADNREKDIKQLKQQIENLKKLQILGKIAYESARLGEEDGPSEETRAAAEDRRRAIKKSEEELRKWRVKKAKEWHELKLELQRMEVENQKDGASKRLELLGWEHQQRVQKLEKDYENLIIPTKEEYLKALSVLDEKYKQDTIEILSELGEKEMEILNKKWQLRDNLQMTEYEREIKRVNETYQKRVNEAKEFYQEQLDIFGASEDNRFYIMKRKVEHLELLEKSKNKSIAEIDSDFINNEIKRYADYGDTIVGIAQGFNDQLITLINRRTNAEHESRMQSFEDQKEHIKKSIRSKRRQEAMIAQVNEKAAAEEKKQKEKQKRQQVIMTIINAHAASGKAMAQYGWPMGLVFGGIMLAQGLIEAAIIGSQKFARGGRVQRQPGTGSAGDQQVIRANPNETVLTSEQQANLLMRIANTRPNMGVSGNISTGDTHIVIQGNADERVINKALEKNRNEQMRQMRNLMLEMKDRNMLPVAA